MKKVKRYAQCLTGLLAIMVLMILLVSCNCDKSFKGCTFTLADDGASYVFEEDHSIFSRAPSGEIVVPETHEDCPVTILGRFSCCHDITKLTGSKNITNIVQDSFSCKCWGSSKQTVMKLSEVIFPEDGNLTSIGSQAFFRCSNLKKVVLPASLQHFGEGVFAYCLNLTDLYLYSTTPPSVVTGLSSIQRTGTQVEYTDFKNGLTIHVPEVALEEYRHNPDYSRYNIVAI